MSVATWVLWIADLAWFGALLVWHRRLTRWHATLQKTLDELRRRHS